MTAQEQILAAGRTVATAESCTGGLIAAALTELPGSSAYFTAGLVTYTEEMKTELLGVAPELIAAAGVVSAAVAEAMLAGVLTRTGAEFGVTTTGFAGPGGGTQGELVGTVYIACGSERKQRVERYVFQGTRQEIREQAVTAALTALAEVIGN
ncbi:MAG: CinA family protein [Veillonellaceae bacterium]|nr:CinA family protein [Veillonellaceae bacterium]